MTVENFVIQLLGWLIGLPLEFLVISALARGVYRQFPLIFVYAAALFVTTLVEIPLFVESFVTKNATTWNHAARIYWVDDWILEFVIFAAVISLIDQAAAGSRARRVIRSALALGSVLVAGITFCIEYLPPPAKFGYWMTPWTRDVSFCAAILDLALWCMLIAARKRDPRLLLISGALGLQFTGGAIGEAIRKFSIPHQSEAVALAGSVVSVAANMTCLYIWWQTFRRRAAP